MSHTSRGAQLKQSIKTLRYVARAAGTGRTVVQIADHLGVNVRTVQREIRALLDIDAPILRFQCDGQTRYRTTKGELSRWIFEHAF